MIASSDRGATPSRDRAWVVCRNTTLGTKKLFVTAYELPDDNGLRPTSSASLHSTKKREITHASLPVVPLRTYTSVELMTVPLTPSLGSGTANVNQLSVNPTWTSSILTCFEPALGTGGAGPAGIEGAAQGPSETRWIVSPRTGFFSSAVRVGVELEDAAEQDSSTTRSRSRYLVNVSRLPLTRAGEAPTSASAGQFSCRGIPNHYGVDGPPSCFVMNRFASATSCDGGVICPRDSVQSGYRLSGPETGPRTLRSRSVRYSTSPFDAFKTVTYVALDCRRDAFSNRHYPNQSELTVERTAVRLPFFHSLSDVHSTLSRVSLGTRCEVQTISFCFFSPSSSSSADLVLPSSAALSSDEGGRRPIACTRPVAVPT